MFRGRHSLRLGNVLSKMFGGSSKGAESAWSSPSSWNYELHYARWHLDERVPENIVFLHDALGSAAWWNPLSSSITKLFLAGSQPSWPLKVFLPELPGHGGSPHQPPETSAQLVSELVCFMETIAGSPKAKLLVASGASSALAIAALRANREVAERLVLINPVLKPEISKSRFEALSATIDSLAEVTDEPNFAAATGALNKLVGESRVNLYLANIVADPKSLQLTWKCDWKAIKRVCEELAEIPQTVLADEKPIPTPTLIIGAPGSNKDFESTFLKKLFRVCDVAETKEIGLTNEVFPQIHDGQQTLVGILKHGSLHEKVKE